MSKKRWFLFALAIAAGLGLGLYYGWVVSPVAYVDTNPTTLRLDFRADYTLTLACNKPGLLLPESHEYVGRVEVVDIGIPTALLVSVAKS